MPPTYKHESSRLQSKICKMREDNKHPGKGPSPHGTSGYNSAFGCSSSWSLAFAAAFSRLNLLKTSRAACPFAAPVAFTGFRGVLCRGVVVWGALANSLP